MTTINAANIIQLARSQNRLLLTEVEAKSLLSASDIPVVQTQLARTRDEAVALAQNVGFPVALKICSSEVVHKSDVGGVQLNLTTPDAVGRAFDTIMQAVKRSHPTAATDGVSVQPMAKPGLEVIIGLTTDPQFGPVCMFGLGGIAVEVLKDVAFRLAPLRPRDAHAMIREIKGYALLSGYRGQPAIDLAALENLLLQISLLPEKHPEIKELDLNPVFAYADGCLAVDARIALHGSQLPAAPRPLSTATRTA